MDRFSQMRSRHAQESSNTGLQQSRSPRSWMFSTLRGRSPPYFHDGSIPGDNSDNEGSVENEHPRPTTGAHAEGPSSTVDSVSEVSTRSQMHPRGNSEARIVAPNVSKLSPSSAVEIRLQSTKECAAVLCAVDVLKMRSGFFHDALCEQESAREPISSSQNPDILWRDPIVVPEVSPFEAAAFLESLHEGRALFGGEWNFCWARLSVTWVIEDLMREYANQIEQQMNRLTSLIEQNHWRTNPSILAGMRVAVFRKGTNPLPTIVTGVALECLSTIGYSKVRVAFDAESSISTSSTATTGTTAAAAAVGGSRFSSHNIIFTSTTSSSPSTSIKLAEDHQQQDLHQQSTAESAVANNNTSTSSSSASSSAMAGSAAVVGSARTVRDLLHHVSPSSRSADTFLTTQLSPPHHNHHQQHQQHHHHQQQQQQQHLQHNRHYQQPQQSQFPQSSIHVDRQSPIIGDVAEPLWVQDTAARYTDATTATATTTTTGTPPTAGTISMQNSHSGGYHRHTSTTATATGQQKQQQQQQQPAPPQSTSLSPTTATTATTAVTPCWADPDDLFVTLAKHLITANDKRMFWEMARAIIELPELSLACQNSRVRTAEDLTQILQRPEYRILWITEAPQYIPKEVASELIRSAYVIKPSDNAT